MHMLFGINFTHYLKSEDVL